MATLAVLLVILSLPATALAKPIDWEEPEFRYDDSRDMPWIEEETEIAPVPDLVDLQHLRIDGLPPGMKLHLDTKGLTVDPKDQVIRLWVFVRSDGGANNGTYEGYRCVTREYKIYAYATPRRKPPVSLAKGSVWRAATDNRSSLYRKALMQDYLCELRGPRRPNEIHQAVRAGKPRGSLFER